jgi:hypothetical protein
MVLMIIDGVLNPNHQTLGKIGNNGLYSICLNYTSMLPNVTIHPASRGVAAHTAGLFRSVRGAKGGVEYEEQSSTGELTCITAGFVNIFLSGRSPSCGISNS